MTPDDRAHSSASDAEFEQLLAGSGLVALLDGVYAALKRAADNSRAVLTFKAVADELRQAETAARLRVAGLTLAVAIVTALAIVATRW